MKRLIGIVLAALVVSTATVPLTSAPASAATPSCKGRQCNGKDPHRTKCDKDAKRKHEFSDGKFGRTELRWSKKCKAGWARFTPGPDFWCSTCADMLMIQGLDAAGRWRTYEVYERDSVVWTPMLATCGRTCDSREYGLRACFGYPGSGYNECTKPLYYAR